MVISVDMLILHFSGEVITGSIHNIALPPALTPPIKSPISQLKCEG